MNDKELIAELEAQLAAANTAIQVIETKLTTQLRGKQAELYKCRELRDTAEAEAARLRAALKNIANAKDYVDAEGFRDWAKGYARRAADEQPAESEGE